MSISVTASFNLKQKENSFAPVLMYSVIFHIFVFFVIPVLTRILWRPKTFVRPKTFQLVRIPQPVVQEKAKPRPKKKAVPKKPVPKTKKDTQPVKKKEKQEDLSELEELLGGLPQPVSKITLGKVFPYQWYINNLQMKVERNWKPSVNDDKLSVVLNFSIYTNGKISEVKINKSSGNAVLDNLALRAVKLAAPFGKIPAGWRNKTLDLSYTLIPALK